MPEMQKIDGIFGLVGRQVGKNWHFLPKFAKRYFGWEWTEIYPLNFLHILVRSIAFRRPIFDSHTGAFLTPEIIENAQKGILKSVK